MKLSSVITGFKTHYTGFGVDHTDTSSQTVA